MSTERARGCGVCFCRLQLGVASNKSRQFSLSTSATERSASYIPILPTGQLSWLQVLCLRRVARGCGVCFCRLQLGVASNKSRQFSLSTSATERSASSIPILRYCATVLVTGLMSTERARGCGVCFCRLQLGVASNKSRQFSLSTSATERSASSSLSLLLCNCPCFRSYVYGRRVEGVVYVSAVYSWGSPAINHVSLVCPPQLLNGLPHPSLSFATGQLSWLQVLCLRRVARGCGVCFCRLQLGVASNKSRQFSLSTSATERSASYIPILRYWATVRVSGIMCTDGGGGEAVSVYCSECLSAEVVEGRGESNSTRKACIIYPSPEDGNGTRERDKVNEFRALNWVCNVFLRL
ncbi:hypothetical protein J6590_064420 [Homalodisca vitripennis]|nr:hypothetical protein J6590_064420 [Homalodisca vitripennis]